MKITITRSFERTRQIADFVPIKAYCEVTAEHDEGAISLTELSRKLDDFCQSEVEKTLMGYRPACVVCGGKKIFGGKGEMTKEGICAECNDKMLFEAKQFKADNDKNRLASKAKGIARTGAKVEDIEKINQELNQ